MCLHVEHITQGSGGVRTCTARAAGAIMVAARHLRLQSQVLLISGEDSSSRRRGAGNNTMCIKCLKRALNDIMTTEHVIAQTGGSKVVALQAVAHPCCSNPRCRKEGHCHVPCAARTSAWASGCRRTGRSRRCAASPRRARSRSRSLSRCSRPTRRACPSGSSRRSSSTPRGTASPRRASAPSAWRRSTRARPSAAARASRVELPRATASTRRARSAGLRSTRPARAAAREVTEAAALESWGVAVASDPAARDAPRAT